MKQLAKDAVKVFPTDYKLHLEIGNAFGKAEALKVFIFILLYNMIPKSWMYLKTTVFVLFKISDCKTVFTSLKYEKKRINQIILKM